MKWLIAGLGVLSFLVLVPLAVMNGTSGFIPELCIFAALTVAMAYFASELKLKDPTFALLILGMLSHSAGIFGWYGTSPIPIQWDHLTHFLGVGAFGLLFFGYLEQFMDARLFTKRNILLLLTIFLAAQGVGAIIELSEFAGYLKWGFGEGAFAFGPGDGLPVAELTDKINDLGGGWINTGWDLTFNTFGILVAMLIRGLNRWTTNRPKPAYYFENVSEWSKKIE